MVAPKKIPAKAKAKGQEPSPKIKGRPKNEPHAKKRRVTLEADASETSEVIKVSTTAGPSDGSQEAGGQKTAVVANQDTRDKVFIDSAWSTISSTLKGLPRAVRKPDCVAWVLECAFRFALAGELRLENVVGPLDVWSGVSKALKTAVFLAHEDVIPDLTRTPRSKNDGEESDQQARKLACVRRIMHISIIPTCVMRRDQIADQV